MSEVKKNMATTQEIARIFSVSPRRVEQLKSDGVIKGEGRPVKFDLMPTIITYIKWLSDKANGREKKVKVADLETEKLEAEKDYKKAKAELEKLKLKELRGELHKAEDIEAITTDLIYEWRSIMMALPGQLAVDVANSNNAAECADIIKAAVYRGMSNIANYKYDPDKYAERVRDREGWKEIIEEEDE